MKRTGVKASFYIALVFLSGALVGGFAHRLYSLSPVNASSKAERNPDEYRRRYIGEMQNRLKLEPGQLAKVNEILDSTRHQYKEFNDKHKTELAAIHHDQVVRVQAILSDSQRAEYDRMRAERDKRRK